MSETSIASLRRRLTFEPGLLVLGGIGVIHGGLTLAGLQGLPCPMRTMTGIPCPLCGLSRGVVNVATGRFERAFAFHAFAPMFVVLLAGWVLSLFLPTPTRTRVRSIASVMNKGNRAAIALAVSMLAYWVYRLVVIGESYRQLMRTR